MLNNEQRQFLALFNGPPARLNADQVAIFLNFQSHDIPVLVAAKLIKPLGNPPANSQKFFATEEILNLGKDIKWLGRATNEIHRYWKRKNANRRTQFRSLETA